MKIVTYNVNGLRPRIAQHGSLLKLLNSLDADIICFQETKLSREEVTADLIMAEGYESFFSCTCTLGRGRLGYSGVATFCRVRSAFSSTEVALPVAAEEGFTGLLEHFRKANSIKKKFLLDISEKVDALEGFSHEDLLKVDSEGRCIITDHGHFVLFNIYGPRAESDDTERIDFKLNFFKLLQNRWEAYLRQGKRVIVVGDLNIAPSAIDRCEAGPEFEKNQFRKWFRSLLVGHGGPFFDVFRQKHPQRKDAYTCWSVASGAEEFNFGSRIDHILVAGHCFHSNDNIDRHSFIDCHIDDCDIMLQFKRWKPDNIPRTNLLRNQYSLIPGRERWKGGRNVKLEGSDHAPVYVSLRAIPDLPEHNTPSLAARYVPKVHGFQQTIGTFLSKRQVRAQVKDHRDPQLYDETSQKSCDDNTERASQDGFVLVSPSVRNGFTGIQEIQHVNPSTVANEASEKILPGLTSDMKKPIPVECKKSNKRAKYNKSIQQTLGSYFQKSVDSDSNRDIAATSLSEKKLSKTEQGSSLFSKEPSSCKGLHGSTDAKDSFQMISTSQSNEFSPEKEKHNVALLEWQRIQELMHKRKSVPLCRGHSEPCVVRVVKKEGPNLGRKFYVCHRAEGPSSNPDARCDYFKWETESRHQRR